MPQKRRRRPVGTGAGIAGQLREIIDSRGLTAYGLGQSAGVAPSVVSRFLNRERGLTLETFDAIAGALGLRLVETARGRGRPSKPARSAAPAELLRETVEQPPAMSVDVEAPDPPGPEFDMAVEPEPVGRDQEPEVEAPQPPATGLWTNVNPSKPDIEGPIAAPDLLWFVKVSAPVVEPVGVAPGPPEALPTDMVVEASAVPVPVMANDDIAEQLPSPRPAGGNPFLARLRGQGAGV